MAERIGHVLVAADPGPCSSRHVCTIEGVLDSVDPIRLFMLCTYPSLVHTGEDNSRGRRIDFV